MRRPALTIRDRDRLPSYREGAVKRSEALPCAVVGLGRIGFLLEDDPKREKPCTHAGAIAANRACLLAGGVDPVAARRKGFSSRYGVPSWKSIEAMLDAISPAIVSLAMPPEARPAAFEALAASDRRPAVVVCEKPVAETMEGARAILAMARKTGMRVLVNHERRYMADYRRAKTLRESGEMGDLMSARARLFFGRRRTVSEVLLHDGTHMLDALRFLVGPDLRHLVSRGDPASTGTIVSFLEGGGVPVVLESGSGRDHLVFEIDLSFERGRLLVGNWLYEEWSSAESPYAAGFKALAKGGARPARLSRYFSNMMANAVRAAKDPSSGIVSGLDEGIEALRLVEEIVRKAR